MTTSQQAPSPSEEFEFTGGALCLDFANTLGDRPFCCNEHLGGYDELLRWSREAEVLPAAELDTLEREAADHPRKASATYATAIDLREAIFRIFASLSQDQQPDSNDLALLNSTLHTALCHLDVAAGKGGFGWSWSGPQRSLDRVLWPVARSAAELLTSDEATLLRECASDTCSWLFVDRSRTRRRRWCDMSTCGNRAKARRHYQRRKADAAESS